MREFKLYGHEPSFLPEETDWKLVWHDEFDNDKLDMSKWSFRRNYWGRRSNTFTDEGIEFDGKSNLKINLVEKDGQYYSAHLQTGANSFDNPVSDTDIPWDGQKDIWPIAPLDKPKFMHRFGYYEVRCKLASQPGWWSAFWLQSPSIGMSYNPEYSGVEVDIMENFHRNGEITSGTIYGGYGKDFIEDARIRYIPEETEDGFHRFGLWWSEKEYRFYCDGKLTAVSSGPVSKVEQFVLLTTECCGYRSGDLKTPAPELRAAKLPDCFTVDYVRVFDEIK